jgi:hypothetical protein
MLPGESWQSESRAQSFRVDPPVLGYDTIALLGHALDRSRAEACAEATTMKAFSVKVEVEQSTGRILAAYFQIRKGKVARTREFAEGIVFADYNAKGQLLGIEQLGPCDNRVFEKIARRDKQVQGFLKRAVPQEMASVD